MTGVSFDIDFRPTEQNLKKLAKQIAQAGSSLDSLEKDADLSAVAATRMGDRLAKVFAGLSKNALDAHGDATSLSKAFDSMGAKGQSAFASIAAANQTASIQLEAYVRNQTQLGRVVADTDSKMASVKSLKKMATELLELSLAADRYMVSAGRLQTTEAKRERQNRFALANQKMLAEATLVTANAVSALTSKLEQGATADGKTAANLKVLIAGQDQINSARAQAQVTTAKQVKQNELLADGTTKAIEQTKLQISTDTQLQVAEDKLLSQLRLKRKELELAESPNAKELNQLTKRIAAIKSATTADERATAAATKRTQAAEEAVRKLEYLNSTEGKNAVLVARSIAETERQIALDGARKVALSKLVEQSRYLNSEDARTAINLEVANKTRVESIAAAAKQEAQNIALRDSLRLVNSETFKSNAILEAELLVKRSVNSAEAQEIINKHKKAQALAALRAEQAYLNSEDGKAAAILKVTNAEDLKAITASAQLEASLRRQATEMRNLNDAKYRAAETNRVLIAGLKQVQTAEAAQIVTEMKLRKEIELSGTARARTIAAMQKQLDVMRSGQSIQQEQLKFEMARAATIARLERELKSLTTTEGRKAVLLQAQLSQERSALIKSTEAQIEKNKQLRLGVQLTAALRAALSGLKTSIGMYTSATILAASAVYALTSAIRSSIIVGAEFTATMARTRAIMGTMGSDTAIFDSLEQQIRSLGMATQFTASEVAEAATELGQAGLSAGEALIALKPTLDLAIIGNLSMAQSADHATNIMMIFGKEVKDLTDIVDVMATAVTNSNTNVDQLANALTYAGPAAQTAGISMRDTVAAIEALANSGFKASRSGTALRRLFVSLLNPTKKGQEVLDRYNISVLDLEGNTRSLTDIIGQMSKALKNVSGAEKLSAIQDLVGVYATSPIAALVEQSENLVALRVQLELTADASQRMREEIEKGLKPDFKQLKSAFQELQLKVFKENELQFQVWTLQVTKFINFLGETTESGVTNLQKYASWVTNVAMALAGLTAMSKLDSWRRSVDLTTIAQIKSAKAAAANRIAVAALEKQKAKAALTSKATAAAYGVETAMIYSQANALGKLSIATAGVSAVMKGAGSLLAKGLPVLGQLMLAGWGIYEVYQMVFGKEVADKIDDQGNRVNALSDKYNELKTSAKEALDLRTRSNLNEQLENLSTSAKASAGDLLELVQAQKTMREAGYNSTVLDASVTVKFNSLKEQADTINFVKSEIDKLTTAQERQLALDEKLYIQAGKLKNAQDRLNDASNYYVRLGIQAEIRDIAKETLEITKEQKSVQTDLSLILANTAEYADRALNAAKFKAEQENLTSSQKLITATQELATAELELQAATDAANTAVANNAEGQEALADALVAAVQKVSGLRTQVFTLGITLKDTAKSVVELEKEFSLINSTEAEQLIAIQEEIAKLIVLREAEAKIKADGGVVDLEKSEETLKRLIALTNKKKTLDGSMNKDTTRKESQQVRDLKEAQKAYDTLRKKYDAVAVSLTDMVALEKKLKLLRDDPNTNMSDAEYARALGQMAEDHLAVVQAQDKQLVSLRKLQEAYLTSPYQKEIDDLAELELALKKGTVQQEEYARVKTAINKKLLTQEHERTKFSVPTAEGLFSEPVNTGLSTSIQMDVFKRQAEDEETAYIDSIARADRYHAAEMEKLRAQNLEKKGLQEAHDAEMVRINEKTLALKNAANETYEQQKAITTRTAMQYEADSRQMMMGQMAGSMSEVMGMIADAAEEGTAAQKVAFIAQKALAVAQILVYTHLAASKVAAEVPFGLGLTMQQAIYAQGYASAGLVASMAIGQVASSGSKKSSGGSDYAGAYDKGGHIPAGKYGIVGEYGPEIVNGPAHVTGREATAKKLGGGGENHVHISPEINIEYKVEGSDSEGTRQDAAMLGQTIKLIVLDTINNELRPNGKLYR